MSNLRKKLRSTSAVFLSVEQIRFISGLELPNRLVLPTNSEFDTQSINPSLDVWEFKYGGNQVKLNMVCQNQSLTHLLKYVCVVDFNMRSAPVEQSKFSYIKSFICGCNLRSEAYFNELENLARSDKTFVIRKYYELKRTCRHLFRMGMPQFGTLDYEKLEEVTIPSVKNSFLIYQDIENSFPSHLKRLIGKGLVEHSTEEGLAALTDAKLTDLTILGLSYATGMRSIQFDKLRGSSLRREAQNPRTNLIRYSITVPLAKQRRVNVDGAKTAIPDSIGFMIEEYMNRFNLTKESQLFTTDKIRLGSDLNACLNRGLLFLQSDETKMAIAIKDLIPERYVLTDFRHNVGHTMAMSGSSAEEIAYILGHSSTVAATYYIMATPELAMVQHKALGSNPVWMNMVGLMTTGYAVDKDTWVGHTVSGMLKGKLFINIGGCTRKQAKCHLCKVRSCYGCFYFRPFKNLEPHEEVYRIFSEELFELIDVTNKSGYENSPMIRTATDARHEVKLVINRLQGGLS
ncbi:MULTISPECIES: hypothetical protein [unclassified Shewanella]|uniref:hypothetical protein n=1 Tax=unclassified Shewanella TaxID=196818 RepID=UPI001BC655E0|nr:MULTISPECIES: hypothetical protein [unclassified Shewanella]GIU10829.1 hypothetical protein TUM4444_15740 [Shewanella sp. MBTL60-112-B1]GIU32963.1 hypothetical protein TUM4445_19340 [Shewanella sp. MBTL60-112-B2]